MRHKTYSKQGRI